MIKEIKKKRIIALFGNYLQENVHTEYITDDVTAYYTETMLFIRNLFYTYSDKKELYIYNKRISKLYLAKGLTKKEIVNIIKDNFNFINYKIIYCD